MILEKQSDTKLSKNPQTTNRTKPPRGFYAKKQPAQASFTDIYKHFTTHQCKI